MGIFWLLFVFLFVVFFFAPSIRFYKKDKLFECGPYTNKKKENRLCTFYACRRNMSRLSLLF